jgi:PAS domain S-box-containing protein
MKEMTSKDGIFKVSSGFWLRPILFTCCILLGMWAFLIIATGQSLSMSALIAMHRSHPAFLVLIDLIPFLSMAHYVFTLGKKNKIFFDVNQKLQEQSVLLEAKALFANTIGKGEFDHAFKPFNEEDVLGKSLLKMRDNLIEIKSKETESNWIVSGIAEVGTIVRRNNELLCLTDEIISFLPQKINAIQGAFFIVNDDDKQNVFIELVASYAYNRKKYLKGKFAFGQGLVGQSIIEKDIVHRTEIPDDYVTITSGLLGDRKPKAILIVPLITNEVAYGALEFTGFERFTPLQITFLQQLSDMLARTIFNVKVNERTLQLLKESQQMSSELSEQREKLVENALEMRVTQEEIENTNARLEEQIEEVNKSQQRTHVLLENASEVIKICDESGSLNYVSPSVKNILGYTPTDIIGKKILAHIHPKGIATVEKMFSDLKENPAHPITAQYTYVKPDGGRVWVESTGRNLINNPYIKGILFNTVDITERRKAEKEQRERAKMQALSENSLDIILRFDLKKSISYVNPAITKYTGIQSSSFLSLTLEELSLPSQVITTWSSLLDTVMMKQEALSTDMEFLNAEGSKLFMRVNVLPEFGDNASLESILMVLHDITDAKQAERKIQEANEKVQESINYAKRIQNSILPQEIVLQALFKESFMLFRPKDVVSGDFPFVVQKDQYVYFAAVDCTGHGVPGALLSLIGSLVLTEILTYETPTPSVVLDKLHAMVVKTLRQGQIGGENERDGMDVGMCRLDTQTGEFMYAGAHRPLYIVRTTQRADEELEEVKGDKYPIGGVQYKGRNEFVNFETRLVKGDRVYLCSDGYPDQFGGAGSTDLKKIGPKKIRELLVQYKEEPMRKVHHHLVHHFDSWKGNNKQIDDVLFIGVQY